MSELTYEVAFWGDCRSDEAVAWLAGLMEGEGSFYLAKPPPSSRGATRRAQLYLHMTDEDVVERAAEVMRGIAGSGPSVRQRCNRRSDGGEYLSSYVFALDGERALAVMERLLPHMGARRRARMEEVIARHGERIA